MVEWLEWLEDLIILEAAEASAKLSEEVDDEVLSRNSSA